MIHDSTDLTVIAHSKDLSEFLKILNLGQAHLVGHSFGANTILLTAIEHPELVSSLTLAEAFVPALLLNAPGGDTVLNNFITKAFMPVAEAYKNNDKEKAVEALMTGVMGDSLYFSKLHQKDRAIMLANTTELGGIVFGKNIFSPVTCDDLKKIKVPVLLLNGDRSPLIFTSVINELDHCLSNKEKATLSNSSHGLEYDNPAEFNRIVLGFINKH